MNLKGRNFLKLMDFTPEEITYMIDLAADLKAKKKQGIPHDSLTGKILHLSLKRQAPEHAALLRWQHMISACMLLTLTRQVPRSAKREHPGYRPCVRTYV